MSKKQGFLGRSKWILLFLILAVLFAIVREEEINQQKSPFFQFILEDWVGWKNKIARGQSVILDLLAGSEPVFFETRQPGDRESKLPFSLDQPPLLLGEDSLSRIEEENRLYQERLSEEEKVAENSLFSPAMEKSQFIDWESYGEPQKLLQEFYTVDSTAQAPESFFQIEKLLETDCTIDTTTEGPQILLYHTHSQEAFVDSVSGDTSTSIVGAGDVLARLLEGYGYKVLHHKGEYDVESRDYAYSNSLPEIEKILQENPSIQVVIDLHRDAVAEDTKLLAQVAGRPTAKVMFFNGMSRSKVQGEISYLENPYLQENLAFSFQMKALCDQYYPGFSRNIYLRAYRYNMHVAPKTLLIELGAQTNTVEEIHNALEPLAHILDKVLSGKE